MLDKERLKELSERQKKYYEEMLVVAEQQIYEEAVRRKNLGTTNDYLIFCLFRKLTAGQCSSIIDGLIEDGLFDKERPRLLCMCKQELARFLKKRDVLKLDDYGYVWY